MAVLITGGSGYIGSAIAHTLADLHTDTVILDDHSTGTNVDPATAHHYTGDIADPKLLDHIFTQHPIDTLIHCAAKISVPDSIADPLGYYDTNVGKTLALLQAAARHAVTRIIFSSSAAVYGPATGTLTHTTPRDPQNPYARSKAHLEDVLTDAAHAGVFRVVILRYCNPIGADPHLRFGRCARSPKHVLQYLFDAAHAGAPFLIHGTDWDTRDGTPLRDFIDINDLAAAHAAATRNFDALTPTTQPRVITLGTGVGTTIYELWVAAQIALSRSISLASGPRRAGDTAGAAADNTAFHLPGWAPTTRLVESIAQAARWDRAQRARPTADFLAPNG